MFALVKNRKIAELKMECFNNSSSSYLNGIFDFASHCSTEKTNKFTRFKITLRKTNMEQKAIPYIGRYIWSSLPDPVEKANNLNTSTIKDNLKKHYLNQ